MGEIYVGIDIAKDRSTACGIEEGGKSLFELTFDMDGAGFAALLKTIEAKGGTPGNVVTAMESTACYHINLYSFLSAKGIEAVIKGASAGKGQQAQQVSSGTCSQDQLRSCQQQGTGSSGNATSGQMLKVQNREHIRDMLKNMIVNQTKSGQGSGNSGAGQRQGSVSMQAAGASAGLPSSRRMAR